MTHARRARWSGEKELEERRPLSPPFDFACRFSHGLVMIVLRDGFFFCPQSTYRGNDTIFWIFPVVFCHAFLHVGQSPADYFMHYFLHRAVETQQGRNSCPRLQFLAFTLDSILTFFFRSKKSLHLFETYCAFLPLFKLNLDFLQAVKVTKSDHHLVHDQASKEYGSIPGLTSQTSLHACLQRLATMQISLRRQTRNIPCPLLARSWDRRWLALIS